MNIKITNNIWGPIFWNLLHGISITYNSRYKIEYYYLIKKIEFLLPCPKCIIHYKNYLKNNIINKDKITKDNLIKWFFNLHNSVNKMLKKPQMTYKRFNKLIKKKNYINHKNIYILLFIINQYYLTQKLSFYHFEQIKSFYILLGYIYPDKNIKKYFKKHTSTNFFKNISDEEQLYNWFNDNIDY